MLTLTLTLMLMLMLMLIFFPDDDVRTGNFNDVENSDDTSGRSAIRRKRRDQVPMS
jgi:hypothetical protein